MTDLNTIFPSRVDFDPAGDLDAFLKSVPGRWVVYLFTDGDDNPIQLLCVKNLRASLKRRLGGQEMIGPTKKVNYRDLVRRVYYYRVDSAFEADWIYYESARQLFPESYRGMVGFRPAWFIHVDPAAQFPRYTKVLGGTGFQPVSSSAHGQDAHVAYTYGPIQDKHSAARLIELLEDAFDLCRYPNILAQSPNGKACPYKDMGKCPAPCDGSISLDEFRKLYELSVQALVNPAEYLREQTRRMQQAATELRFETAAKIKSYIDLLSELGKGPYRHVRRLCDFNFLCMQRGPWEKTARVFLISPAGIEELAGLIVEPKRPGEVLRLSLEHLEQRQAQGLPVDAERIGIVAHHLFAPKSTTGVFLPVDTIDEKSILKAFKDLQKQKPQDSTGEDEGVIKELQAM